MFASAAATDAGDMCIPRLAWILALLLAGAAGVARADEATAAALPTKPFSWLVGRWVLPGAESPSLYWGTPFAAQRFHPAPDPARRPRIELTVTEKGEVLLGKLVAIFTSGRRSNVATFSIDRGKPDCPLIWRESGFRYQSALEGVPPRDIPRLDRERFLHFSKMRRRPGHAYPKGIEFRMRGEELLLRRTEGPQHGAALSQTLRFSRSPD